MRLVKLKMKVLLTSEEQMEMQQEHDFGEYKDEDKKWVYRTSGMRGMEIYMVFRYNKTKTLVETYEGKTFLVDEPFDQVFDKWQKSIENEEDYDVPPDEHTEENISHDDEEDED